VEAQEAKKDYADVHATYERFLETLRVELEKLEQESGDGKAATNNGSNGAGSGLTPISTPFDGNSAPTVGATTGLGGGVSSATSSFNTQVTKPSSPAQSELAERRAEYGLAYIIYMRFGRRAEGIKASRAIFGKARRDRWSPWQVYEAAGTFFL
jgi:cleavage stimulation factor subunit 3